MNAANELAKTLKRAADKTSSYDSTATVTRIEGGTAWVHIPGGVSETPASMTIDAKPGDTVQVRVSGGRAFLVGNSTAPPTDDTKANKAKTAADEAKNTASKAKETADGAKDSADSAIHLAEGVNEHFWHDNAGAHITEDTQEDYQADPASAGGNTLITSQGMAVRRGQTELAVFSASGAKIGDGSSRIEIESGGMKVFNEDSVPVFDIDAKGGSTRQRKTETIDSLGNNEYSGNMRIERNGLIGASSTHVEIDLSGLSSGTSVAATIDSFTVESTGGANFSGASPTLSGFALLSQTGRAFTLFFIAQSFTIGTDYTGYATASFPTTSANGMATIGLTIDYDSSTGILSIDIGGAQAVVSDVTYIKNFYTTCRMGYYVTTAAPAYTLGTRDAEQTPGDFSCVIGERLYADSGHQLAVGKYNVRDAADKYPLIVGNGSSDSARSNALTVDWDGNVSIQGSLTLNGSVMDDYVIDEGQASNWLYRKWKSGKIEAWLQDTTITISSTTAVGNVYRCSWSHAIASGVGFSAAPQVFLTVGTNAQYVFGVNGRATSATAISGYAFRANASSSTSTVTINIYAVGY